MLARRVLPVLLCAFAIPVSAQTTDCVVSGVLFKADGTPAVLQQVPATSVVKSGASFIITPLTLSTDAFGEMAVAVPKGSTLWIAAAALGLSQAGDLALPVPTADVATLSTLLPLAKSPVGGVSVIAGITPIVSISLKDFGIELTDDPPPPPTTVESFNGRGGTVALTSTDVTTALGYAPVAPNAVVGAVNASADTINAARLAPEVVRRSVANVFSVRQTFDQGLQINGASNTTNALEIQKAPGSSSGLDLRLDGSGKSLRIFATGVSNPRTYFNDSGMLYSNGWVVLSGTYHGQGDGFGIDPPSGDSSMLQIWSSTSGPAVQVRNSPSGYLLSGLDAGGNYTFGVEGNGALRWGATTRAAMDTNLYRSSPGNLKTDGSLSVAALGLTPRTTAGPPASGNWSSGTIIVDALGDAYICVGGGNPGTWRALSGEASAPPTAAGELGVTGAIRIGSQAPALARLDIQAADQPWAVLRPADPAAKPFWFHTTSFPNPGDSRNNEVMRFGWNLEGSGGVMDLSDGALGLEFEGHYAPDANRYFEHHLAYVNRTGRAYRPISWMINKGTDFIEGAIQSSKFSWYRPSDGAQWMSFQPFQIDLNPGTVMQQAGNNTPWLKQLNASGTAFVPLMYLTGADVLSLAPSGVATNVGGDLKVTGSLSVGSSVTIPAAGGLAVNGDLSVGSSLAMSATAPTILSGFGTSPSIVNSNGTTAFTLRIGSGGTANAGIIGLPQAANGWNCFVSDRTSDIATRQISTTPTSATISAGAPWHPSDILQVSCFGY
jgi:hypothetical protein